MKNLGIYICIYILCISVSNSIYCCNRCCCKNNSNQTNNDRQMKKGCYKPNTGEKPEIEPGKNPIVENNLVISIGENHEISGFTFNGTQVVITDEQKIEIKDKYSNAIINKVFKDYASVVEITKENFMSIKKDFNRLNISFTVVNSPLNRYLCAIVENKTIEEEESKYYIVFSKETVIIKDDNTFALFEGSTNRSIFIIGSNDLINLHSLFCQCTNLENIDLSLLNTSKVTDLCNMFKGCKNLEELNLSNFKTKNVTNMGGMFEGCSSLKELNINNFNTENVNIMSFMFYSCESLKSLDLSSFNITKKEPVKIFMLAYCHALRSIIINKNQEGQEDFIQKIEGLGLEKNVAFKNDKNPNLIQFIKKDD